MSVFVAHEVAAAVGGELAGDPSARAIRVATDTRAAIRAGDLYVGLRGPHFDGGRFARRALDEGARIAIVGRQWSWAPNEAAAVIAVDDPLAALQSLASAARARFAGTVVAITGSNGKTTTKDMLMAALGTSRRVTGSPMSFNSQVGVALTLLSIDPKADVAIVECGVSLPGEMARLRAMVRPDAGIFVNVGDAHLQGLGTRERTASEKAELFAALGSESWVLVPSDEPLALEALRRVGAPVVEVDPSAADPSLRRLIAEELEQDVVLAVEAAVRLGADRRAAVAGLQAWKPAPMRLEVSETASGVTLVNDAYTSDPESLEIALSYLKRANVRGRRVAVLGGMEQLGVGRAAAHRVAGERVAEAGVDLLVAVGVGGREIAASAVAAGLEAERVAEVASVDEAAVVLAARANTGDWVLLKASRPEGLERLAPLLFGAVAPTRMRIDLDVLIENFRGVQRCVGPNVGVIAVVKSFGYGLDAIRVGAVLETAGAALLCVAYADEGAALREAGVTVPILVQNVVPGDAPKIVEHGLTAELADAQQLAALESAARARQRAVRAHIKVDTGMGRSGLASDAVAAVVERAVASEWVVIDGLMTHFAASDEPEHDEFTRRQIARFDAAAASLTALGAPLRWVHAANTSAIARFPEAHYTAVRCGLGMFGYAPPEESMTLGVRPVMRLTTQVVMTRRIAAGDPVGYGMSWVAARDSTIAVVAIGYGDGYPRSLSNRGWMSFNGIRCPVVGRVCMDVTMIDVTDSPTPPESGAEIVVFGDALGEPDLREQAALAGTIPYELLARLAGRVRRIFVTSR